MRLGLIGDTHGYVPALEAAINGCRGASVDRIVHCGDFLTGPASDAFSETIALLQHDDITVIAGNSEIYPMHWGTPAWDDTVAQRRRRPDPPDQFLATVPGIQAQLTDDELAWLRALPTEAVLSCARPNDVYVCHAMPGDPFHTIWDVHTLDDNGTMRPDPAWTPAWEPGEINAALSRPQLADADLILCGHVPTPLVMRLPLPNDRTALIIRGVGYMPGNDDGTDWMVDYWLLDHVGPSTLGFRAWTLERQLRPFKPR